jgi:hypothetical protein
MLIAANFRELLINVSAVSYQPSAFSQTAGVANTLIATTCFAAIFVFFFALSSLGCTYLPSRFPP